MRKTILKWTAVIYLVIGAAIFSFASNQGIDHAGKKITIGWFGPLSGAFQKIGEGMIDGMKANIERLNSLGGVAGYTIILKSYDNNNDPIMSKQIVKKLIQEDRVFAIVGALGAKGINAVITDMEKYGLPIVYLGGGETHWAVPPKRNIFPIQPDYITEGRLMVQFAIEKLNARRIAFIYRSDDNTGRTALVGVTQKMKEIGRKFGAQLVLETKRESVEVMIAKLKSTNPDSVILFDFFGGAAGLVAGAKRAGINVNWVTTYVNGDSIIYTLTGKPWLGVYIGNWQKAVESEYTNFEKYFKTTSFYQKAIARRWDAPSGYNAAGWVAIDIFLGGLKLFQSKYRDMKKLNWDNYINSLEGMRNFNNTIAKDISYYPMATARPGTRNYFLARRGQMTMYYTVASLTPSGKFYLKPVTGWLR